MTARPSRGKGCKRNGQAHSPARGHQRPNGKKSRLKKARAEAARVLMNVPASAE